MKDWMKRGFVAVLCILLVVSMVRIHELKEQLERETGYLQSQIQSLENQISGIYNNVDQMLEQEASLLTFSQWEITSIDVDNLTANVAVAITPKEYQAGMTEAFLQGGSEEHPMTMEDGSYRAELEVPLFDSCEIDAVVLRDSTYTRTEHLDWSIYPRYILPDVYASLSGSWSGVTKGDGIGSMWSDCEIRVRIDQGKGENAEIKSVHLVQLLDGNVQERTAIPADEYGEYTIKCKESYKAPFGSRFEIAADVVDQYGLTYRCIIQRWDTDKEGNLIEDDTWLGRSAAIYSQDGKLLYME